MKYQSKVHNVSHTYHIHQEELPVLKDISFSIHTGQVIVILGPSGCGKSTLLKCIAGLITPKNGTISIDGATPSAAQKRKYIGLAFQEPGLLDWLTVEDNIILPANIGAAEQGSQVQEQLDMLLDLIEMKQFRTFLPNQLSGGMKQRVALARALLLKPRILLLDEPFGALDVLTRTKLIIEFSDIIRNLGVPTVLVTHSVVEALFVADRILILSRLPGKILHDIEVDIQAKKDLKLFEDPHFVRLANHCRALLLHESGPPREQP